VTYEEAVQTIAKMPAAIKLVDEVSAKHGTVRGPDDDPPRAA
jgi:hypothetical protein